MLNERLIWGSREETREAGRRERVGIKPEEQGGEWGSREEAKGAGGKLGEQGGEPQLQLEGEP